MSTESGGTVNPCVASGCNGGCCRNMLFYDLTAPEARTLVANRSSIEIPREDLSEIFSDTPRTYGGDTEIYTTTRPTQRGIRLEMFIKGACPNLEPNGNCAVYESRPEACRKFELGSVTCTRIRDNFDLPPVEDGAPLPPGPMFSVKSLMRRVRKKPPLQ